MFNAVIDITRIFLCEAVFFGFAYGLPVARLVDESHTEARLERSIRLVRRVARLDRLVRTSHD